MKKVVVIGSGFAGLSAATFLAKAGYAVTVVEKHLQPGGRARKFEAEGFVFDMGPSWYWMPEVFEKYFNQFGRSVSDFYELERLDPSYRVHFPDSPLDLPASYDALRDSFESLESGSGLALDRFLKGAQYKYEVGINKLVFKPGNSVTEFADLSLLKGVMKLDVFASMRSHVRKYFDDSRIRQLLEFPVLFLGATAEKIPALYSLMNYADIKLGTWYPKGGMHKIVEAMYDLAIEQGVHFEFGFDVQSVQIDGNVVSSVTSSDGSMISADVLVAAADYQHVEQHLLPESARDYEPPYWQSRVMAPSCLLYYVGLNKKLTGIRHHTLFFDVDFDQHANDIYKDPKWPSEPLFYVCAPSVTDATVAPANCENLFFLVPVASHLNGDTEKLRDEFFEKIVIRYERLTGQQIRGSIIYKRSYGPSDFAADYGAFGGNAYGLANTLMQTAMLKPRMKSRTVSNLYYTGQLTVPGPGVPPSIISGEVVANEVCKAHKLKHHVAGALHL